MDALRRFLPNLTTNKLVRWGAIGGAFALLFALVIFLSEGELSGLGFGFLIIGVLGLGAWVLIAPEELRDWLSGRQVYYGTGTVVLIVVVIAVAVTGYAFAQRQNAITDLTEFNLFTISEPSREAVEQLGNRMAGTGFEARIIGFYARDELRERKSAEFLLRQFVEEADGWLELEFVDPEAQPQIARQYGYGAVSVRGGTGSGPVYLGLFSPDGQLVTVEPIGSPGERNVATAMLRVAVAGQFKVYFVRGHLEYDPELPTDIGLSGAATVLPEVGINIELLDLPVVDEIPPDATAIVIAGAQTPFSQADVDKIDAYIQRGGRMLVLADPPYIDGRIDASIGTNTFLLEDSPFNRYLWNEFGVRLQESIVADSGSSVQNEFNLVPGANPVIEVTSGLDQVPIIMPLVRSVEVVETPEPETNQAAYRRDVMLFTTQEAFGERTLQVIDLANLASYDEGEDIAGPLALGVAVRRVNETELDIQPRVVIIGDTDWLTNLFIAPEDGSSGVAGNILLWNNIVEWLTRYSEIATIQSANRPDLLPLVLTDQQQSRIQFATLVLLPGAVLGLGLIVWGIRRRH
ncbi:MAG: GldG family protein [Chloroflexi bacterium]|nr:GldG family protein [Chloroflexota bacterium]